MPTTYQLVSLDGSGNVDTVYGEFKLNEDTNNPVIEAVSASLLEFGSNVDADGNDISNIGTLAATDATVSNAPTNSTDVARKNEVDGKADTDANVESFATAGSSGTVPTSQGDGTLQMEEVSGGGSDPSTVQAQAVEWGAF